MNTNQGNPTTTILIVEGETIIAFDLKRKLESLGYTIIGLELSAEKAIEACQENSPDLVLMDIILQGRRDGIKAAEIIRSRWGIPVVFLTTYADHEQLKSAQRVYPFGYLLKPFREEDLNVTVEMALYVSKVDAERRKAEKSLRENQQLLERTFVSLNEAVFIVDASTTKILDCNQAASKMFGYSREEMVGQTTAFLHVDKTKLDEFRTALFSAVKENGHFQLPEFQMKRKDGTIFPTDHNVTPLKDEEGQRIGWVSAVRDISERKKAGDALMESREYFRLISETIDEVFWMADSEIQRMFYVSPAYEKIWGSSLESLYENPRSFIKVIYPEDRDRVLADYEVKKNGGSFEHEYRIVRPDGSIRWIWDRGFPIRDETGKGTRYVGIAQDITERKQDEEELKRLHENLSATINAIPDLLFEVDRDGRIFDYSAPKTFNLYVGPDVFLGKRVGEVLPPDAAKVIQQSIDEAAKHGNSKGAEYSLPLQGETKWFELSIAAKGDYKIPGARFILLAREITERKQAEEALRESKDRLRALSAHIQSVREEERSNISREIHDDLGQLLTGLKMDLSWILRHLYPEQEELKEKTQAMGQLIDQTVQTVRRISTELRPRILDDFGLEAALEWQAGEFTKKTRIPCLFRSSGPPLDLKPDLSIAIFRIFQETLTNVARHSGATKVESSLDTDATGLLLTIRDNGRGIPHEENVRPKSLGLVGMRERALIFGGTVEIKGKKGKGTSVILRLPMNK
jgi:PAS domain S-box-containing protein